MATYSLTLRGEKGQKLTAQELDNNFLYVLENATGGSAPLADYDSGIAVPVQFAGLMFDNSTLDNEWEVFVLAGSQGNFESIVFIDVLVSAPEGFELTLDRGTPEV